MKRLILYIAGLIFLAGCSTTKHLPEGEILYTGQKPMIVLNRSETSVGEIAMEEVEAALATAPNNSLLGSSTIRYPFPFGLWIYNGFQKYEKGFGKWIFNKFAATPVLMSTVNPDIRQKAAVNLLRDYGYFNGSVSYKTFIDPKDSLKAKLQYTVNMRNPYFIDTVYYRGFSERTTRIMELGRRRSLISSGEQFNVADLDGERTRISTLLRNVGCYYFRPDYLTYQADTMMVPNGHVQMRLIPVPGMPKVAEKQFRVGRKSVYLLGKQGQEPNDSMDYKGLTIHYYNKPPVRPNMLYRWLNYQGYRRKRQIQDSAGIARQRSMQSLYSLYRQTRIQERLASVGIFRYAEMQYIPRDTAFVSDTLDVRVIAALDKPYDAELDFNVTMKSNNQTGPGAAFTVTKNNVFGGGESWNVKLNGSYEWQTGNKNSGGRSSRLNSYELGLNANLSIPRLLLPSFITRRLKYPGSTTFQLGVDLMNRPSFFRLIAFSGSAGYNFQTSPYSRHSLTVFKLTYNKLLHTTEAFDKTMDENPAIAMSFRNQFVPSINYTYTFDKTYGSTGNRRFYWQNSVTSAGNLLSGILSLFGEKQPQHLFGNRFSQFVKEVSEVKFYHRIGRRNNWLATRLLVGVGYAYGNSEVMPYSEQFYIGGANSIRAFTIRSLGPGSYRPPVDDRNGYLDQTGDFKLEANVEYRFGIMGRLNGAVFLDAGNIWLLKKDPKRPGAELKWKGLLNEIALGTGFGLRYDISYLVIRADLGIGIHTPYPNPDKTGYYNISSFKDGLGFHLAIGYPF